MGERAWLPSYTTVDVLKGRSNHLSSDKMAFTAPIRRSTLPKTNIFAHENRPGLKRKRLYSNHPFSGANCFFQGRYTPFQLAYPAYQMVTLPIYQWNLCFLQTEFFSFKLTPKTLLYLPKTSQIQPSKPQGFGGHLDSFRSRSLSLSLFDRHFCPRHFRRWTQCLVVRRSWRENVDVKYCYIDVIYKGGVPYMCICRYTPGPSKAVKFQPQDLSFGG